MFRAKETQRFTFDGQRKMSVPVLFAKWSVKDLLLRRRWPWHALFWTGYALFRFWLYYVTITYYPVVFLEYMLLSELLLIGATYFTLWLYKRLFKTGKHFFYFAVGTASWILYLGVRTAFQFAYLRDAPGFKANTFSNVFLTNITFVVVYFVFLTSCKYFKDGYIAQQFDAEKKEQQLKAEINNLKSQIAPHFLFNTLNNLYGLAVEKSDKLPDLMLRLSDLLRHSLYETQKPFITLAEEINVLESYVQLESVRLEGDLQLSFENLVPKKNDYLITPLLLIVFVENAFKHAKFVQGEPVKISIKTAIDDDWFSLTIRNNYNRERESSANGIGLTNVKRRLEILYPAQKHQLTIIKDEIFYTVYLQLQLAKTAKTPVNEAREIQLSGGGR